MRLQDAQSPSMRSRLRASNLDDLEKAFLDELPLTDTSVSVSVSVSESEERSFLEHAKNKIHQFENISDVGGGGVGDDDTINTDLGSLTGARGRDVNVMSFAISPTETSAIPAPIETPIVETPAPPIFRSPTPQFVHNPPSGSNQNAGYSPSLLGNSIVSDIEASGPSATILEPQSQVQARVQAQPQAQIQSRPSPPQDTTTSSSQQYTASSDFQYSSASQSQQNNTTVPKQAAAQFLNLDPFAAHTYAAHSVPPQSQPRSQPMQQPQSQPQPMEQQQNPPASQLQPTLNTAVPNEEASRLLDPFIPNSSISASAKQQHPSASLSQQPAVVPPYQLLDLDPLIPNYDTAPSAPAPAPVPQQPTPMAPVSQQPAPMEQVSQQPTPIVPVTSAPQAQQPTLAQQQDTPASLLQQSTMAPVETKSQLHAPLVTTNEVSPVQQQNLSASILDPNTAAQNRSPFVSNSAPPPPGEKILATPDKPPASPEPVTAENSESSSPPSVMSSKIDSPFVQNNRNETKAELSQKKKTEDKNGFAKKISGSSSDSFPNNNLQSKVKFHSLVRDDDSVDEDRYESKRPLRPAYNYNEPSRNERSRDVPVSPWAAWENDDYRNRENPARGCLLATILIVIAGAGLAAGIFAPGINAQRAANKEAELLCIDCPSSAPSTLSPTIGPNKFEEAYSSAAKFIIDSHVSMPKTVRDLCFYDRCESDLPEDKNLTVQEQALHYLVFDDNIFHEWVWKDQYEEMSEMIIQRYVLTLFALSSGHEEWKLNKGWAMENENECDWFGLHCEMRPAYTRLVDFVDHTSLSKETISGTLPGRDTSMMMVVTRVVLSNNNLKGHLPPEIFKLRNLERLEAYGNELSGTIPTSVRLLTSAETLWLHDTKGLNGTIPSEIGRLTNLRSFWVGYNRLEGTIPDVFKNMTNLNTFAVNSNNLKGTIPNGVSMSSNLERLFLDENLLTGTLPVDLGNVLSLVDVRVHTNQLTGKLPLSLTYLNNLKYFYIHKNKFDGPLPGSIVQDWKAMRKFEAYENEFTGTISTQFGQLPDLVSLDLHSNNFDSVIPSVICNAGFIEKLDLSLNSISGRIPNELARCTRMVTLDLSFNLLTGPLPTYLKNFTKLQNLNLRNNPANFVIPRDVCENLTICQPSA